MRFIWLLLFLPSVGFTQSALDAAAREIKFEGDSIESIFKYVATTVSYDTKFKDAPPEYHSYDEVLKDVLDKEKGVCMHYATLFHALCTKFGFKSYMIGGYTKFMNQKEGKVPHAWNAVEINGEWFLFDPTWASGYVVGEKFLPYYEKSWFKQRPEEFIYSHIPFDPVFQFQENPPSHNDIVINVYSSTIHMDYESLLKKYDDASEKEKLELSLNRISRAGVTNSLIKNKVNFIKEQINIYNHNQQVYTYSESIELLKKAEKDYELYLTAKKQLFKKWKEDEISYLLLSSSEKTRAAYKRLASLQVEDEKLQRSIQEKIGTSDKLLSVLQDEKQFFNKYQKTWKPIRVFTFL